MAGAGLAAAHGSGELARMEESEREGKKGVRDLPCYLTKLQGGELVEEERRSGGAA